jgi:hypothetical protein
VDELKEVGKLNSVLLKEKQEFEAKLAEESQAKDGKHFPDAFSFIIESCPSELWTNHGLILLYTRIS